MQWSVGPSFDTWPAEDSVINIFTVIWMTDFFLFMGGYENKLYCRFLLVFITGPATKEKMFCWLTPRIFFFKAPHTPHAALAIQEWWFTLSNYTCSVILPVDNMTQKSLNYSPSIDLNSSDIAVPIVRPCSGWWIVDHLYNMVDILQWHDWLCNNLLGLHKSTWGGGGGGGGCLLERQCYVHMNASHNHYRFPLHKFTLSINGSHCQLNGLPLDFFFIYTVMKFSRISTYPRKTWIYYYRGINGIYSSPRVNDYCLYLYHPVK